jgi:acyl-CoA synthetase (AMP-forming)/AMP-acid ligase II
MAALVMTGRYENLGDLLEAVATEYPDNEAFIDDATRFTFGHWYARASQVAGALARRGVGTGDVVALTLPTGIDFAVCYTAVLLLGGVVTGLNTRLGGNEVAGILGKSGAAVVITGEDDPRVPAGFGGLRVRAAELAADVAGPPLKERPHVAADAPAVIVWTSGTTGAPKGAWFDHTALAAGAECSGLLSEAFDRRLMPTPFAHAGFMTRVWDQLAYVMASIITPTPWSARAMLDSLVAERATVGQGVPTQWEKLLLLLEAGQVRLPDLRVLGTGAARVPAELVRGLRSRLDCPVLVRYACTEAPIITGTRPGDEPRILEQTVGRPQDGISIKIMDDAGRRSLPQGEVGRVAISSPFLMRGYWHDPEQTAAAFAPGGSFVSSDLGSLDADGNLILAGRASEVYIRGGYNVYPLEVENVLSAHPSVQSAAVVGIAAPVIGEIGVAYVVPEPGHEPDLATLRKWCAGFIADYKAPDRLELIGELPLNAVMKVDKLSLARRARGHG